MKYKLHRCVNVIMRVDLKLELTIRITSPCDLYPLSPHFYIVKLGLQGQGQLLEGVECHIYLYCFTFDDINLNRAFVIMVLFPKIYSNKKVCANDKGKTDALGIY